jgi:hypothetical protein
MDSKMVETKHKQNRFLATKSFYFLSVFLFFQILIHILGKKVLYLYSFV